MKALLERIYPPVFTRQSLLVALAAAVFFQGLVLIGMYALSALPLITGTEVRLKTIPVDPRSLFRGNYALLGYDISRIEANEFSVHQSADTQAEDYAWEARLRMGEPVYVRLKPGQDGLYEFDGVQLTVPSEGVFLRGRVRGYYAGERAEYEIDYGIEAFFAPKEKVLALERQLRTSGVAVLKVSAAGTARLADVVSGEQP